MPLFILLGNLMNGAGITGRLVGLATTLAGWMRGGLAQSTLILSTLMGGVSGSAVGRSPRCRARILGEPMIEKGYDRGFTGAVLAIGGLITATLPTQPRAYSLWLSRRGFHRAALFIAGVGAGRAC